MAGHVSGSAYSAKQEAESCSVYEAVRVANTTARREARLAALTRVRSMEGVMPVGLSRMSFSKNNHKVHEEDARSCNCPVK